MEPINTRDPAAAARAYVRLEWPVALGHRYRPRQGCTCEDPDCPTPGAHPAAGPLLQLAEDNLGDALESAPGAALIAATERFDVLIVPRRIGMAVMVDLDRVARVPCLIDKGAEKTALFVLPATGCYADPHPALELRTGPDEWIALPPSHGLHWDTPPWMEQTGRPHPLLHGADVGRHLADVFKITPGGFSAHQQETHR
ncbi:hypothetical protein [Streptomyces prunicolor]|uniref:hypothetical protein n=1 Tax=Streptomyces prunicolor TaxID=67348 RepID=UPI00036A570C|nr:hypothetical protein [Streptomyces prunicolor]